MLGLFDFTGDNYLDPSLQLTPHFKVSDLSKTDTGIENRVPEDKYNNIHILAEALEKLYTTLGPIKIVSAYRNEDVNQAVGGASSSRHLYAEAADFYPTNTTPIDYWFRILGDSSLRSILGEITYKEHQGTIHVTIPYGLTKGSARIAELIGGQTIYKSITSTQETQALKERSIASIKSTAQIVSAGIPVWAGLVALMGALGSILYLRKKF